MINKVKILAAAAAITTLPIVASAATVTVEEDIDLRQGGYSFAATVNPDDDGAMFTFTILEALEISGISLSGTGSNNGVDVGSTRFQVTNPNAGPTGFSSFETNFGVGEGGSVIPGQVYTAGTVLTVEYQQTQQAANPISFTVSFPVAEVPVPAAGLLLLGALGGIVGLRRRKKA